MKLNQVIENLVAEFGSDEDQSKTAEIANIISKAAKNVNVPDNIAEVLMSVGHKLKAMGLK
jgi:hypothetical protein